MQQLNFTDEKKIELTNQFAIERYKFILDKIKFLDTQYHGYLTIFIKIITTIITLIISSVLISKKGEIDTEWVEYIIKSSSILVVVISLILIRLTSITIQAWQDYRDDEVKLLNKFDIDIDRKPPSNQKEKHWNETAFITLLWVTVIVFSLCFFSTELFISTLNH